MANKPWTKSEEKLVIQMYPTEPNDKIAKVLGRSVYAINTKAGKLGVKKEWSDRSKFTLCWDCAKYNGGCNWSANHLPVEGWTATPTAIKQVFRKGEIPISISSYIVHECPEFVYG
jgi:hypothetical protein